MRCRSWKPLPAPGHDHPAGTCRTCWGVCWSTATHGMRCEDCLWALAQHPSVAVRRQLVAEDGLPFEVLELLATDFDATVQAAAGDKLEATSGLTEVPDLDDQADTRSPRKRTVELRGLA